MIHSNFPINAVYQWSRGPEEAILYVDLNDDSRHSRRGAEGTIARASSAARCPSVRFSFEPADIVNEVMSFGSPTPVEIAVSGPSFADEPRSTPRRCAASWPRLPSLRDLQVRPVARLSDDRSERRSREGGPRRRDAGRRLARRWSRPRRRAGSSCRTTGPIRRAASPTRCRSRFRGPSSARPTTCTRSARPTTLAQIPLKRTRERTGAASATWPSFSPGTMPGQYDRYNMRRQVTLTANVAGAGSWRPCRGEVAAAIERAGAAADRRARSKSRGQIPPMREMQAGLAIGLGLAVVVVFLLLTANFQSLRLALVAVSTAPAVVAGVVLMLLAHRHDAQHPVVHRRDHGDRRGDGERDSAGHVCRSGDAATERRPRRAAVSRRRQPAAGDSDDQLRDDRRHVADGAGPGRSGPAERAAWAGR